MLPPNTIVWFPNTQMVVMGFRFSLSDANILSNLFFGNARALPSGDETHERRALDAFVEFLETNYTSSEWYEPRFRSLLQDVQQLAKRQSSLAVARLRWFFQSAPWSLMLIPSRANTEVDQYLTSPEMLKAALNEEPLPGFILQITDTEYGAPQNPLHLDYVFQPLKTALAHLSHWPGALVWTPEGDSQFFELPNVLPAAQQAVRWLLSSLSQSFVPPDLALMRNAYETNLAPKKATAPLFLLHLSDIHLGSKPALRRLGRIKQLIENVLIELPDTASLIPILSGDLMDTPSQENLAMVQDFIRFLIQLGLEDPVVVPGNHDIRDSGFLLTNAQQAVELPYRNIRVFDEHKIAFVCFNSSTDGKFARGKIGETQFMSVANELDTLAPALKGYLFFSVLHHHPVSVTKPSWYRSRLYESLLGTWFEKTGILEDANQYLQWLDARNINVVFHGHKHIPRFNTITLPSTSDLTVIGCGSTVGLVDTNTPNETFMSMNLISLDRESGILACQLRAERVPGAGLVSTETHNLVFMQDLS